MAGVDASRGRWSQGAGPAASRGADPGTSQGINGGGDQGPGRRLGGLEPGRTGHGGPLAEFSVEPTMALVYDTE